MLLKTKNMNTEFFNLNRMRFLLRRQWALSAKSWRIAIIASVGINLAISMLILFASSNPESTLKALKISLFITLLITGMVFTSLAFKQLQEPTTSVSFLTLPASNFEKYLTGWLFTFPLYLIVSYVLFQLSYLFISLLAYLVYDTPPALVSITWNEFGNIFIFLFIIHSVFFLGGIWFKKMAFFNTLLAIFVISMIHNLWVFVWARILFPINALAEREFAFMGISKVDMEEFGSTAILVLKIFMLLVSVMCLVTAYFKLKEREG